jgi:hypothetical protein
MYSGKIAHYGLIWPYLLVFCKIKEKMIAMQKIRDIINVKRLLYEIYCPVVSPLAGQPPAMGNYIMPRRGII